MFRAAGCLLVPRSRIAHRKGRRGDSPPPAFPAFPLPPVPRRLRSAWRKRWTSSIMHACALIDPSIRDVGALIMAEALSRLAVASSVPGQYCCRFSISITMSRGLAHHRADRQITPRKRPTSHSCHTSSAPHIRQRRGLGCTSPLTSTDGRRQWQDATLKSDPSDSLDRKQHPFDGIYIYNSVTVSTWVERDAEPASWGRLSAPGPASNMFACCMTNQDSIDTLLHGAHAFLPHEMHNKRLRQKGPEGFGPGLRVPAPLPFHSSRLWPTPEPFSLPPAPARPAGSILRYRRRAGCG